MSISLAAIERYREATVHSVGGDRSFRRRIMEMGLLPGTTVWVTNTAPIGGPMQIALRDFRLSIRRSEAEFIEVDPA